MLSGNALLQAERRKRFAIQDTFMASGTTYNPGQIIPVGTPVLVTALHVWTSTLNVFSLQSGGSGTPNDVYVMRVDAGVATDVVFKTPLLLDGLAAQWLVPSGTIKITIAYRILEA